MFDDKYSNILNNITNLTSIYWNQKWWKKIKKLEIQRIEMTKKDLIISILTC